MMLRYSLNLPSEAKAVEDAVRAAIDAGLRTKDMGGTRAPWRPVMPLLPSSSRFSRREENANQKKNKMKMMGGRKEVGGNSGGMRNDKEGWITPANRDTQEYERR